MALKMKELLERRGQLQVGIKNLTSEISILGRIEIHGISGQSLSLSIPAKSCSLNHQLFLRIDLKNLIPKASVDRIEIIGKVTELHPLDEKRIEVVVSFNQFSREDWQIVMDHVEKKQEQITEIVEKLKHL